MANTKLKHRAPFISAESLNMGATVGGESIATAGGTVPAGAGTIWLYVPASDNIHWHPTGAPTASFGHAVKAQQWFSLTHSQQTAKIFSDDGLDVAMLIVYMRGAGRTDSAYSLAAPY